jgi:hypothetical protein
MPTIRVSTDAELATALTAARGGDKILLAGGNYGTLRVVNQNYASEVTIASADPRSPAHFTDLKMAGSSNVKLSGIQVGRGLTADEPIWTYVSKVENNVNITIERSYFHGSLDGDSTNDGNLLFVRNVPGFRIDNSKFEQANAALIVLNSKDVRVAFNSFFDQKVDAMEFGSVQNIVIQGNYITGHHPTGPVDHPDGIQFWTHGTTIASENIVIRDNVIWQGNGKGSQGIFMKDELGTLPYKNVQIFNNLIYNKDGYWHGISLDNVRDVMVSRNTAVSGTLDAIQNRVYVTKGERVSILDNVTDQITLDRVTDLVSRGNVDFKATPARISLLPKLAEPGAVAIDDLVLDGIGFQPIKTGAVAKALGGALSEAQPGASHQANLVGDSFNGAADALPASNEALYLAHAIDAPRLGGNTSWGPFDSFALA